MDLIKRQILIDDLPDSLMAKAAEAVRHHIVAFYRPHDGQPMGSGILVRHRDIFGVLTARHVWMELRKRSPIALLFKREVPQDFRLEVQHLVPVVSPNAVVVENGPDLAFFRIPSIHVGTVKAAASFVEIETHRRRVEDWGHWTSQGLSCLVGYPYERKEEEMIGEQKMVSLEGSCGVAAGPTAQWESDGFDYYEVEVSYEENLAPPRDFEGVSGGALFQAQVLRDEQGQFHVGQLALRGVAFYQTPITDELRHIRCHGAKSIYGWLRSELEKL